MSTYIKFVIHAKIKSLYLYCFISCLLGCITSVYGDDISFFHPHEADYKVSVRGITGELKTSVKLTDADGFLISNQLKTTGLIGAFLKGVVTETAEFKIYNTYIRPNKYYSLDTLSSKEKELQLDFNWQDNILYVRENQLSSSFPLSQNVYDRITLKYAIMNDLKNDRNTKIYRLHEGDKIKEIKAKILPEKTIKVPTGTYNVIGIQNQASGSSKMSILWCAIDLDYLPVRIQQYRNDKLWMNAELIHYRNTT